MKILDLGCGIGFWVAEFGMRGLQGIVAADLTKNALEITDRRCKKYGIKAELKQENAKRLSFSDNTFDHVNCQGVIHHTPDTEKAIFEIARVLKPGGTASISVYYKNAALRFWPWIRWIGYPLTKIGAGMKGRGREHIFKQLNVDEIVRLYDGSDNPIGKSYTKKQFQVLCEACFSIQEIYYHFFPARSLPLSMPKRLHQWLDRHLPFMVYANLRKPCAE
nr:methyltransferase domain-containing protein [uncultured Desulfobacter sp.]